MKHAKKRLFVCISLIILLVRALAPVTAFAEDTPTPTVTETPTSTPQPSETTPSPTVTPSSTPTPTPNLDQITPTPTPDAPEASNSAQQQTSNTGGDTPTSNTSPTDSGTSSTTTGNATSVTQVDNDVNTTSINSQAVNQTINIFLPQDGNINLSDPSKIATNVVSNNTQDGAVFNISIVNNNAYVDTNVVSIANTGSNTASGSGNFAITTGNATSLVELVNKVNVTLVNSEIHFITINIYGTLKGNIILPSTTPSQNCSSCGSQSTATNDAIVTNNIGSSANTGNNSATGNSAAITTGNANAQVTLINIINQLIFGISFNYLIINDFGTWNGNFLGWGDIPGAAGGTSLGFTPSLPTNDGSATYQTTTSNTATVTNTITSLATTGNNSIMNTTGNGMILTGNAQSIVSLINLINSVFINTKGVFAFINIFGTLEGDIGDASKFITPTPTTSNDSNTINHKESGGQLTITNTNNTGPYILPGVTVTFFFTIHNPGTGKVYNAHLRLALIKNGVETGAATYPLGDIDANKSLRLSTGLVMSKYAPGGEYIAHAEVTGTTGEENTALEANADSTFHIFVPYTSAVTKSKPHHPAKTVLAAHTPTPEENNATNWFVIALLVVTGAYLSLRLFTERHHLIYAFTKSKTFKERLSSLRLLLF